ncbi:hypothetical protein N7462_002432 [Penicillium macrosclerotiorum]|uniref:uncharacterized protein n=1 Tax=Penicillium macrosclerotiorum TaxID=303699 RepID=UPI0025481360|nr:uncharacterized protein N7462_002432 [Penicillium macrosclerotiorum]KAJ5693009.1 hypothetical protein N7462_002432 [Penicillium macrosclerotiorum]
MLKPFQIKNLRGSVPQDREESSGYSSGPSRVVQISATDYDDIASNHPRARLTYVDDEDGDQITVGSSLELSQRLDEPIDIYAGAETAQLPQEELSPMHLFDIRRSNSVTELWRRFEQEKSESIRLDETASPTLSSTELAVGNSTNHPVSDQEPAAVISEPEEESQPFLAAFEAELANLLDSADTSNDRAVSPETSQPPDTSSSNANNQRAPHPLEVAAATFLYHLVNGANSVQSELRSRLPELQRQLHNAQTSVPENVRASLQTFLTTVEAHMRTAFNNLPENGRHMAEEAINAGRPVAENAAESLRMMASDFNEASRTLFAAFEHEFGRFGATEPSLTTPGAPQSTSPGAGSHGPSARPTDMDTPGSEPNFRTQSPHERDVLANQDLHKKDSVSPEQPLKAETGINKNISLPDTSNEPPRLYPTPPVPPPKEPSAQSEGSEKKVLFIGNIGFNVTERMIQDVFASKGFIVNVHLPLDSVSGKHAGFGYVDFPSIHPAMAAMDVLQGIHIDGHAINLEFSEEPLMERIQPSQHQVPQVEPDTLYGVFTRQELSSERSVGDINPRRNVRPISRRKSVSFKEPDILVEGSLEKETEANSMQAKSPLLIDLTNDEPTSVPSHGQGHDDIPSLDSDLEMSRFPPVSQLEAQLFANQQRNHPSETTILANDVTTNGAVPESHPQRSHSISHAQRPASISSHAPGEAQLRDSDSPVLRRANTITFAREGSQAFDDSSAAPLNFPAYANPGQRRLAREGRPSRSNTRAETDTWARLDRRERRLSRSRSHHSIPGSFPVEAASQLSPSLPLGNEVLESQEDDIERCISSLMDMGYGTPRDGGRSRIAVYAAASNGSLLDAIEMIEEERKVYARQGRN